MENIIKQLIADFQEFEIPELITRDIAIPTVKGCANTIIGMRRVGKTYLLFQEMRRLIVEGVEKSHLLYLNFEDERLAGLDLERMHLISDIYFRFFPENRDTTVYFFFDEIQNIKGWEKYCRRLLDTEKIRLYLTGSSSTMLSSDIASSMRGRSINTEVYPFSFSEFLASRGFDEIGDVELIGKKMRSELEHAFQIYLCDGGFPAVQKQTDFIRCQMLQGYVDSVIFRDIVERHGVTHITILRHLLRRLLSNPASRFSVNKFYNEMKSQGMKCGKNTLHAYLDYLQDTFLVFSLHMKTNSERQRMVNPRKIYAIDTGLVSAYLPDDKKDIGHLLENIVYMELRRRQCMEINYIKTKNSLEVDFYVKSSEGKTTLLQICADMSNEATRNREVRAILDAVSLPSQNMNIITLTHEETIKIESQTINVIPAWKWLLS